MIERRFGPDTVYLTAEAARDSNSVRTNNTVPANIKVYNIRLPDSVFQAVSLLKQVRAKLAVLEPLLRPFLPRRTEDECPETDEAAD